MRQIIECEQGTLEWHRARAGIPTASEFAAVMAKGKDKMRHTYMLKLAGEILTGEPMENFSTAHTKRGHAMEPDARDLYCYAHDCVPERIGFIRNGDKGCSPDSLIGPNGMLEVKTKLPHLLIDDLLKDEFPPEHKAQCQGALWVAEREWIDIAVYWPGLPLFIKRAYRDENYILTMSAAVNAFNAELQEIVARVKAHGQRRAA